ncbi:MAG: hypothetical protein GYB68_14515, partial [Chloroflexi bacterium]|nr:hypothetical protein [Chloroflexota bacterium]
SIVLVEAIYRVAAIAFGLGVVGSTLLSAIRTFVLPRNENAFLSSFVFIVIWRVMRFALRRMRRFEAQDRLLAYLSPIGLLALPVFWLFLIVLGYTGLYFGVAGDLTWRQAFILSGSSLMTLGYSFVDEIPLIVLSFSQAALGMMLIALLIGYLPTMYSAYSNREKMVIKLEIRAGTPPSAVEMIKRLHLFGVLEDGADFKALFYEWEDWFIELEENHTTLSPLNFYRSHVSTRSWLTAAGVVLDAASLTASCIDLPHASYAGATVRAGYVAINNIAEFFGYHHDYHKTREDPISITREEFDAAYDALAQVDLPLYADREACWQNYRGWRVNYDSALLLMTTFIFAPRVAWVSDRHPVDLPPGFEHMDTWKDLRAPEAALEFSYNDLSEQAQQQAVATRRGRAGSGQEPDQAAS